LPSASVCDNSAYDDRCILPSGGEALSGRILTEVSATVDPAHESELVDGFRELLAGPIPDGLLRTELLRGQDGQWRINTLWRDREALAAMQASSEPPAAPRLFRSVGAEPSLRVYEIAQHLDAAPDE
jgi:heme-degrading monooxygenase HmoA